MSVKTSLKVAGIVSAVLLAQAANASHFRGGALVPSVDANGLVSFTSTSFWRTSLVRGTVAGSGGEGTLTLNGSTVASGAKINRTRVVDTADSRFTRVVETFDVQLSNAGTANFEWSSCCHVSGAANATSGEALSSSIAWDGKTANTPILFNFSAINPEVVRGTAYANNLGALAVNGGTLTYNTDLSEGIIAGNTPTYTIDPSGQLEISAAVTSTMTHDNAVSSNPGADYAFSGNILNNDGSSVEFEWMFDAVDTGTNNLAPIVNNMVINVILGDMLSETVTGTDPEGVDPLLWDLLSIVGPGDTSAFTFNQITQEMEWDTGAGGVVVGTYLALIRASDGILTNTGLMTINVTQGNGTGNVPEPGALALLGLGLAGMGVARRRKSKK